MKKKDKKILYIILFIAVVCVIAVVGILWYFGIIDLNKFINNDKKDDKKEEYVPQEVVEGEVFDDFQIHFLELGNQFAGDCTYIKAGDNDILIDAGSREGSASTIKNYLSDKVLDNKLEYVIATHAHQDHIAGFAGDGTNKSLLLEYEIGTIIDFSLTNQKSDSPTYAAYINNRDSILDEDTFHYTAKECFNNEGDAKDSYVLLDKDNKKVTMTILYNKFYFETSSDENNYSVCTLFTYKDNDHEHNYLLTGDLEKAGEKALANYYDGSTLKKTLPHCDLFKAGHHGSPTSSNDVLLSKITPDICCVCCCAGKDEYTKNYNNTFPSQAFINRIAKYTDQVYVTTLWSEKLKKYESMNGNIIVSSSLDKTSVASTNNLIKLKDSAWFNQEIYVEDYVESDSNGVPNGKLYYGDDLEGKTKVKMRYWPTT